MEAERGSDANMGIEALCSDTLLLRTPMVVLGLHLEEVQAHMEIGAHANLLTHKMPSLVTIVHRTVLRIVIEGIIRCDYLTVDLLDVILVASQ